MNRVGRNGGSDHDGGNGDTPADEIGPERVHGPAHAFLRGVLVQRQRTSDILPASALEETQHNGILICRTQGVHGVLEMRSKGLPRRGRFSIGLGHIHRLRLASAAGAVLAQGVDRLIPGDTIKPARQGVARSDGRRLTGQLDEDCLSDILGQSSLLNHPQRSGINQVDVARHQFDKGLFSLAFHIIPQ